MRRGFFFKVDSGNLVRQIEFVPRSVFNHGMSIKAIVIVSSLFSGVLMVHAAPPELADLVPEAEVKKLAGGMQFVEGPVWSNDEGGYPIFSDIPANELKKFDPRTGNVTTFR